MVAAVTGEQDKSVAWQIRMHWVRLLIPFILVFAASCTAISTAPQQPIPTAIVQTVVVGRTITATPEPKRTDAPTPKSVDKPTQIPTKVWTGKTLVVETKNLVVNYPDFVDPAEARKHADILQRAYETYYTLFAFGKDNPFGNKKTTIHFDQKDAASETVSAYEIRMHADSGIFFGLANPPHRMYFHELIHTFQYAQKQSKRYYIYHRVGGMNEASAAYLEYYFGHEVLKYSTDDMRGYDGSARQGARHFENIRIQEH